MLRYELIQIDQIWLVFINNFLQDGKYAKKIFTIKFLSKILINSKISFK